VGRNTNNYLLGCKKKPNYFPPLVECREEWPQVVQIEEIRKEGRRKECTDKCKVKLSLFLTNYALRHEGVCGNGCRNSGFLDFGTSRKWVVSITPRLLYSQGKCPRYTLDLRLGGSQSLSVRHEEEQVFYPTANPDPSVVQPVASRYTDNAVPARRKDGRRRM
jgi:hypothetical protein